jgi:hypothetical protein
MFMRFLGGGVGHATNDSTVGIPDSLHQVLHANLIPHEDPSMLVGLGIPEAAKEDEGEDDSSSGISGDDGDNADDEDYRD